MRSISLALLLYVPLGIASDADVISQFGMLGLQAIDCAAPAGPSNPHLIYAVSPQGNVMRTLKMKPDLDGTFPLRNLRMSGPNVMQWEETGRTGEVTVSVVKMDGKFRSWRSVKADGTVLIADGKFTGSGASTVAFERCP